MSVQIRGQIFWANDAVEINTTYNKDNTKYKITIGNISDKAKEKLEKDYGIKIRNDKEGQGFYFRSNSKYKFILVDSEGNPVEGTKVGNGSEIIVKVTGSFDHKFSKQYGKSATLDSKVTVTNLVKYEPKDDAPFDEDTL